MDAVDERRLPSTRKALLPIPRSQAKLVCRRLYESQDTILGAIAGLLGSGSMIS